MEWNMDNDRKIDALIAQSRSTFLQELGREFQERQKQYDLEEEFAKTKKNRSFLVPFSVLGVTLLLIGSAFFMASWIQTQTLSMDVGIEAAFSDVNLRDVLDTVKRNESEMQQAQEQLRELNVLKDRRIQIARDAAERESLLLVTRGLSVQQQNIQNQQIQSQLAQTIEDIEQEFAPRIAEAEALIADIQLRIDQYDARQLELARAQEEILNNQQRLFDLERQRLVQNHTAELNSLRDAHMEELVAMREFQRNLEQTLTQRFRNEQAAALAQQFNRFNPVFQESGVISILSRRNGQPGTPLLNTLSPLIRVAEVGSADLQDSLTSVLQDLELVMNRLESIPYENSVPQAFGSIRDLIQRGFENHGEYQTRLNQLISQQRSTINQLNQQVATAAVVEQQANFIFSLLSQIEYSLGVKARQTGDFGFIIDPRNSGEILFFATDPEILEIGTIGLVFREDSRLIGRIQVISTGPPLLGSVVSLQEGEFLAPFDSLVFEFQGGSVPDAASSEGDNQ